MDLDGVDASDVIVLPARCPDLLAGRAGADHFYRHYLSLFFFDVDTTFHGGARVVDRLSHPCRNLVGLPRTQ